MLRMIVLALPTGKIRLREIMVYVRLFFTERRLSMHAHFYKRESQLSSTWVYSK